jgi:hypothetical protein
MNRGVVIVAYGNAAVVVAREAVKSIQALTPGLPIGVISDVPIEGAIPLPFKDDPGYGARWAKLNADLISPFEHTLYLDADTRAYRSIDTGFDILDGGWDMALACSERQWADTLGHLPSEDRAYTLGTVGIRPVNLQAGVIFFKKNKAVADLFEAWRQEWRQFRRLDQGALLRALQRQPVKVWLLGRPWNGGYIIGHRFGAAVSK